MCAVAMLAWRAGHPDAITDEIVGGCQSIGVMVGLRRWCRATVVRCDGTVVGEYVFEGAGRPDLGAVDGVARLALLASRVGGHVALVEVSTEMRELLDLVGLAVEVEGQSELGEEPLGIQEPQERIDPGDPVA
jgi:hypothetical protein